MPDAEFVELLAAQLPRLRRLAHRVAPRGTDPEDLVQDTLERAWRGRHTFRGDAGLSTWLHRIVINRALDLSTRPGAGGDNRQVEDPDLLDLQIDDAQTILERAADAAQVRAALSRLSTDDRMVLALHDGEGWAAREIADITGVTTAATHKRLQRARFRLARELGGDHAVIERSSPECRRTRASASAYLDGRLDDTARSTVEDHLRACRRCPPLAQALVGLRNAVKDSGIEEPLPAHLSRVVGQIWLEG